MDFERRQIKKQHSHRIILEFDVIGDIDLVTCRQIAVATRNHNRSDPKSARF
jgi:hypothetical protein